MSEPTVASQPSQEFEKVLSGSSKQVASFDTHDKTPLQKAQHFLHKRPAAVPLIVLVLSLIVFGSVLGSKFFSAFSLTLILQQVAITGIVGAAQTLVILTAGGPGCTLIYDVAFKGPAELASELADTTWRQWRIPWEAASGAHSIMVRATDGTGEVQTAEVRDTLPDGATGHHQIRVTIEEVNQPEPTPATR